MIRLFIAAIGALAVSTIAITTASAEDQQLTPEQVKAREIYATIIGIRSAKGQGKVPDVAKYLVGQLKSAGFTDDDIEIMPLGETAALGVRYRGDGSSGKKPILFMAHMDVVDAKRSDWEYDPFVLREEDGYFIGRGTSDNKYGVTNLTQSFMRLKQEGFTPNRDLVLVFTGDEETDMATTRMLAYDRKDWTDAEFALNSDGGGGAYLEDGTVLPYTMQAAEKTYATFKVTARNPGGHSSRPRPDNAIYDLAKALIKIEAYTFPVMANEITRASARADGELMGDAMGKALVTFADNPKDKKAIKAIRASRDYSNILSTTCVATMLDAGHAENALPQSAEATVNCRIFPGVEIEDVRGTLAEVIGNDALEVALADDRYVASPVSDMRDDVTSALSAAISTRYPDVDIVPAMSSGGTDGMHYRRAGVPTYGVSGRFGKIGVSSNAHGLNERLPVTTFYGGLDHWIVMIKELAGPQTE
ncbi:M20/M25/M40 family metallo-hydrolase [Hyphococcus sp.]|uniref:M20/M25/M40 family metallo-hydrolase n=1 Tax=Hyphococcus sp. TaxID=2038636 RepID=UPI002089A534|nr:MAG: peptidase M20 [Marinicaulis sp.]